MDSCNEFFTNNVTIKQSLVMIAYQEGDVDMCKLLVDYKENCKLLPITRSLEMAVMMGLNFFGGADFSRTWPKVKVLASTMWQITKHALCPIQQFCKIV